MSLISRQRTRSASQKTNTLSAAQVRQTRHKKLEQALNYFFAYELTINVLPTSDFFTGRTIRCIIPWEPGPQHQSPGTTANERTKERKEGKKEERERGGEGERQRERESDRAIDAVDVDSNLTIYSIKALRACVRASVRAYY